MKKMLLAILSCLYLGVTSGMQVRQHYCMGLLKTTTISFQENTKCGTCGMEVGSSTCCHDESHWLKVKDNHQGAFITATVPTPVTVDLPVAEYFFSQPVTNLIAAIPVSNHSPPPLLPNRNLLFCVFRI